MAFAAARRLQVVDTFVRLDDLKTAVRANRIEVVIVPRLEALGDSISAGERLIVDLLGGTAARCLTADGLAEFGPISTS